MKTEVRHDGADMVIITHVGRQEYEDEPANADASHDLWVASALSKRLVPDRTYTVQRRPRVVYNDAALACRDELAIITGFTIVETPTDV